MLPGSIWLFNQFGSGDFPNSWLWDLLIADQPIRIAVTLQTIAVLAVNRLCVWQSVTILAACQAGMLDLVTIDTVEAAVVGVGLSESNDLVFVTGVTERSRDIAGRNNFQGLMGRMALGAVFYYLS